MKFNRKIPCGRPRQRWLQDTEMKDLGTIDETIQVEDLEDRYR